MSEEKRESAAELSDEELKRENAEPLPDREAMSVMDPGPPFLKDPGVTLPVEPPATE
jgi:hypothetical protein